MKKFTTIILPALLLLIGTSCTKSIDIAEPQAQNEVVFSVANYSASTKADDSHGHKELLTSFGTFAWYTDGSNTHQNQYFMTNQKISKNSASEWVAEGAQYYWPKTGNIDFISYAPFHADAANFLTVDNTAHQLGFAGYKVNGEDLMYSDKASGLNLSSQTHFVKGVPMLFHHALATVKFNFTTQAPEGITLEVKDAEIRGIASRGDYNWGAELWNNPSEAVNENVAGGKVVTVLPQSLSAESKVLWVKAEMKITRKDIDGVEVHFTTPVEVSVPLKNAGITEWKVNKAITYNITVTGDAKLIQFSAEACDWSTVDGSISI